MPYISRRFYLWSFIGATLIGWPLLTLTIIVGKGQITGDLLPVFLPGEAAMLYVGVVLFVFYYQIWRALPPDAARTSPGKAVGFMFIPLFQFYWMFQVLWGWAVDFNRYVRQHSFDVPKVSQGVPLALCIIGSVAVVASWIGMLTGQHALAAMLGLPSCVLWPIFIYQACTSLNALPPGVIDATLAERQAAARQAVGPDGQPTGGPPPAQGQSIASLVLGILSIVIPYIGLILGIIAIVLSRRQRRMGRSGMATAGLILGIIGTAFYGLCILIIIVAIVVTTAQ